MEQFKKEFIVGNGSLWYSYIKFGKGSGLVEYHDLYDSLMEYSASGIYPFHMPGHKRNTADMPRWNPWQIDLTEVEGTDNLYHAGGILKKAMDRAAALWGADRSYFLVNGSTGGILSAIAAVSSPGDTVLVARNCHKSVYHAIFLNHLKAIYLAPEWIKEYGAAGGIEPRKVGLLLERYPQIRAIILTSPTYEGIVSDVGKIAEIAHKKGIALIVDEAHGAHLNQEGFPVSAVQKGADIVIQSCHKTLPALTQTGLLHLTGSLADRERIEEFLSIYQTSSPSYLLMASIDRAAAFLETGRERFRAYADQLDSLREKTARLTYIHIPAQELVGKNAAYDVDNSKLILALCGKTSVNGKWLYKRLRREYSLQCEMAMEGYALAMTSVMDTPESFQRLLGALEETDRLLEKEYVSEKGGTGQEKADRIWIAEQPVLTLTEAFYAKKTSLTFHESAGRISGEYLYLYPPGTPLLAPGERITTELIKRAEQFEALGFELQGLRERAKIQVI